jgi:methionyl-tRNA synthetase
LNYDGGQFSTSQGRGIFMDQALDILPSDYWRWWLLTHVPENSDSEFTWDNFQLSINKDLADVLGNFVSRVTKFCRSKFGEEVPETSGFRNIEIELIDELQARINKYQTFLETLEIRKASSELRKIWVLGNEYLQKTEPWAIYKFEPKTSGMIINLSINLIRLYAILSEPFIPDTSQKIMLAVNSEDWSWPNSVENALQVLPPKHSFNVPDVLFNKITDDERDIMQKKFSGL